MCFVVFGHALYEKMLSPRVGITGKGILLHQPNITKNFTLKIDQVDQAIVNYLLNPSKLKHGKDFCPLPVLGVPGWFPDGNYRAFYENLNYFRSGRHQKVV